MSLSFTCNFTFNTTKQCFSALLAVILRLFIKNGSHEWRENCIWRVNFKQVEHVEFHSFEDLIIITSNGWQHQNIMNVVLLSLLLFFWVSSTGCLGEFYVVIKHFQDLKNLMLNMLKEKLIIILPCRFFFP